MMRRSSHRLSPEAALLLLFCASCALMMRAQAGCPYADILGKAAGLRPYQEVLLPEGHPKVAATAEPLQQLDASGQGRRDLKELGLGLAPDTKPELKIGIFDWDAYVQPQLSPDPKMRDWASVLSACQAAGKFEKRLNNFFVRTAAHDALAVDPTCGGDKPGCGGADGSFITMDELLRPENTYDNFGKITARVVMKIAQAFDVSAADVIAVCGAEGMRMSGGPGFFDGSPSFPVGRKDTWIPNGPNLLLPADATAQTFADYFQAHGMDAKDGVALIGSHALLDEQACFRGRNNNPRDYCNPEVESCDDVRMFIGDGGRFFTDVCTPSIEILDEDSLPKSEIDPVPANEAIPLMAMSPASFASTLRREVCKFTSKEMRDFSMNNMAAMRAGKKNGPSGNRERFHPIWYEDPYKCLNSDLEPVTRNCYHPHDWMFTVNDAFLGRVCQGQGEYNEMNPDMVEVREAMRSFTDFDTWADAYKVAYYKMINLGVTWAAGEPTYITGRECYSGYVADPALGPVAGLDSNKCAAQCNNGDGPSCPAACRCKTSFGASGVAWIKDAATSAILSGTTGGTTTTPPLMPKPAPIKLVVDPFLTGLFKPWVPDPPVVSDLFQPDQMPALQGGFLPAVPPSPYTDQDSDAGLCPPAGGGDYRVQGWPGTPYEVVPFQELFENPPTLDLKASACRPGDGHCLRAFELQVVDYTARPWDATLPGCASQPDTWFLGYGSTDGTIPPRYPGPTLLHAAGHESAVRFVNNIGSSVDGGFFPCVGDRYGRATATHFHGAASVAAYDGWAEDKICGGEAKTYIYPNNRATTGWYHDHSLFLTSDNVYRGLAGLSIVSDKTKHGGCGEPYNLENMPELHLVLSDKLLSYDCQLRFDHYGAHHKNLYGDINLVSGKPFPRMELEPKWYRMRLLNNAVSRPFLVKLKDDRGKDAAPGRCWVIAGDGGYRASPVAFPAEGLLMGVAERYEVVCDLSGLAGRTLYLWNGRNSKIMKDVPYFCYSHLLAKMVIGGNALDVASCGSIVSTYKVLPGFSWGTAPTAMQTLYTNSQCDGFGKVCAYFAITYGVQPGSTWGTMPDNLKPSWAALKCDTVLGSPTTAGSALDVASCGSIISTYNVLPRFSWGTAPPATQKLYTNGQCEGFGKLCAYFATMYGVQPKLSWGTMPDNLKPSWSALNCDTVLGSPTTAGNAALGAASCGSIVRAYGVLPAFGWGTAPTATQTLYKNGQCDGSGKVCAYFAITYGVQPGSSWGTMPGNLKPSWSALKCDTVLANGPAGSASEPKFLSYITPSKAPLPVYSIFPSPPQVPSPVFIEKVLTPTDYRDAAYMAKSSKAHREFEFDRSGSQWTINGETWDSFKVAATDIGQNTWEVWKLSTSGSWFHVIHVHLVDMYLLRREGVPATTKDGGVGLFSYEQMMPKDMVFLGPGQTVYVLARFGPHQGQFMFHCHNLVHEDDLMMRNFNIVQDSKGKNAVSKMQFTSKAGVLYDQYQYNDPMFEFTAARPYFPIDSWTDYAKTLLDANTYKVFYPTAANLAAFPKFTVNPWRTNICPLPASMSTSMSRSSSGGGDASSSAGSGTDAAVSVDPAAIVTTTSGSSNAGVLPQGDEAASAQRTEAQVATDAAAAAAAQAAADAAARKPAADGSAVDPAVVAKSTEVSSQSASGGGSTSTSDKNASVPLAAIIGAAVGAAVLAAAAAATIFLVKRRRAAVAADAVLPSAASAEAPLASAASLEIPEPTMTPVDSMPPSPTESASPSAPILVRPRSAWLPVRGSAAYAPPPPV